MSRVAIQPLQAGTNLVSSSSVDARRVKLATQDVRPFNLSSFVVEDYTLRNGIPHVAPLTVAQVTVLSAEGEYAVSDRDSPWDWDATESQARFIPSDSTWDPVGLVWQPAHSNGLAYRWTAVSGHEPFLEDVTYRVGKELITQEVLYFPPGAALFSSFNNGIDDAASYAVVMVLSLEHPTPYTLFGSQSGDDPLSIVMDGESLTATVANNSVTVSPKSHPIALIPLYLVLSVKPGSVTLWVGDSSQNMRRGSATTSKLDTTSMSFTLGADQQGNANTNMRLLDWSLWPLALSEGQSDLSIWSVLSHLGSIYGTL